MARKAPKGGGKAASGYNLYTPVSQNTIDKIKKMGMTSALKKAGSSNNAEFVQGVKRMYGVERLKAARAAAKPAAASPDAARSGYGTAKAPSRPKPVKPSGRIGSAVPRGRGDVNAGPRSTRTPNGRIASAPRGGGISAGALLGGLGSLLAKAGTAPKGTGRIAKKDTYRPKFPTAPKAGPSPRPSAPSAQGGRMATAPSRSSSSSKNKKDNRKGGKIRAGL